METAEQSVHLKRLGCDLAQGTYLSKPLPAGVATPLLDAELGKPGTAQVSRIAYPAVGTTIAAS